MPITVSEQPSIEHLKATWAQIVLALEPLVDTLSEPYKSFFDSPVKLLIGNKISLAIIPPKHMYSYIRHLDYIYSLMNNIDHIGYDIDYVLIEISKFLGRLGLSMSVNGEFLIKGPMSHSTIHQRQEVMHSGLTEGTPIVYTRGGD